MPSDLISSIRKATRQIHNASQLSNRSKKDKIKTVIAIINEIQIQDSCSSDEEAVAVPQTKTVMMCKLSQISPEIWITLSFKAKKWLSNERKCQQYSNHVTSLFDIQDPILEIV
jgi:hypothetical protein